jgi:hypothetical protein
VRELKEGETTDDLIRLPDDGEVDTWLAVPTMEALLALQRALPDGVLRIVAGGVRTGDLRGSRGTDSDSVNLGSNPGPPANNFNSLCASAESVDPGLATTRLPLGV